LIEFSVFHVAHITLESHVWHENTGFNIPFSGKSVDLSRKVLFAIGEVGTRDGARSEAIEK
jgi:hypothetical protein